MRHYRGLLWLLVIASSLLCAAPSDSQELLPTPEFLWEEEQEDKFVHQNINLLFYIYEREKDRYLHQIFPYFTYKSVQQEQEDFFFWPFLAGYEVTRSPSYQRFPLATGLNWYAFPIFTLEGNYIEASREGQTTTFVSLSLLTFFQQTKVEQKYSSKSWYSLPVFSSFSRQTLVQQQATVDHMRVINPLFTFEDTRIRALEKEYSAYRWELVPTTFLLGERSLSLASYQRWGAGRRFDLVPFHNFALFHISTWFTDYPGAEYKYFSEYQTDVTKGAKRLFQAPSSPPTTRLGFLSPMIQFESDPADYFSLQVLPLFHYISSPEESWLTFLPLAIAVGSGGVQFLPHAKLFPLLYYDDVYKSLDILWPLIHYRSNPEIQQSSLNVLFLFDYEQKNNSLGQQTFSVNMAEGLLFSYSEKLDERRLEILPFGILFSYREDPSEETWRLLGFGYSQAATESNLYLFFLPISLGN